MNINMSSSETDYLLKLGNENRKNTTTIKIQWRGFLILCLVTFLYFQPLLILNYLVNEWIQHSLKLEYFPDGDFSGNFSSCKDSNHSSEGYKLYTEVQQNSAHWIMYINIALNVTSFFSNLILSCYTDTYGRKFLFILTSMALVIRSGAVSVVIYTSQKFTYIVGAYAMEGLTGSHYAYLNASFSYIADIIKDTKKRVLAVVFIEAVLLLNSMVSGLIAGVFVDKYGFFIPALTCTGITFLALVIVVIFLPEALDYELRIKPISIPKALKRPFEFYTSSIFAGKRLEYVILLLAFGFAELGSHNRSGMETVYLLGMPFCWTPTWIGYYSLARHFGQAVIGLGSVKLCQKCMSNELIAITSTVFCFASYMVEALATSELVMYMVAVICVFSFSMIPVIRGIMSTITPADKQGSMFASVAAVEVISSIAADISENTIYAATVSVINGFVFFVMAGYILIDFILLVVYTCIKGNDDTVYIHEQHLPKDILPESLNADREGRN